MNSHKLQKTFSMIKPDAHRKNCALNILDYISKAGFNILKLEYRQLSKDEIVSLYEEHKHKPFFGEICDFISSHPVLLLVLEREDAVAHLREIMGSTNSANAHPTSIRGQYGDKTIIMHNVIHGSDSEASAQREMKIFGLS